MFPYAGEDWSHGGVVQHPVESSRYVVCQLDDVVSRVRDPEVPNPNEVALQSGAVEDWRIFVLAPWRPRVWDVVVRVAIVVGGEGGAGVNTESALRVAVSQDICEEANVDAVDESKEETREQDVV